ncbi:MAG: hypothetical protein JXA73_17755 [Acidobacteria bacterium]|nr:hypothetical protein [Acidobacteriota bacterium]
MALDDQFSIVFEALKQRLRQDLKDEAIFKQAVGGQLRNKKDVFKTDTGIHNMDYGGWFNYFWNEATSPGNTKGRLSEAEMGRIAAVVFPIELKPNRPILPSVPLKPRQEFLQLIESGEDKSPEEILTIMFNAGFEPAQEAEDPDSKFIPNFALAANMVDANNTGYHGRFAFRGEGRSPFTVKTQEGARCRADLDDWIEKANVNAWWHPWKGREGHKKAYFRKGHRDNDFISATSLALKFSTGCAYPMVHLDADLAGPVSSWGVLQRSKATQKGFFIVKCLNNKRQAEEELLAMVSYVYVMDLTGQTVFKTWTLNDYPESGTRSVTMDNMIACVRILRILFPAKAGECFNSIGMNPAFTVHPLNVQLWPSKEQVRARLKCTEQGISGLETHLKSMIAQPFDVNHNGATSDFTYVRPKGGIIAAAYSELH